MNLLAPTIWDIALGLATLAAVALTAISLMSVLRSDREGGVVLGGILLVLFVPVIGPIAWLASASRYRALARH
ncbi:hypothetical protein ET495_17400 (plasmid) [Xylanimonas allomyrinae]|uniref:Cardiolipin synthase N-terminal domain-containing protein n=1 Tax=Xylanimonas allomyrinae TaxID=2509459 RepID=A0A4P6EWN9_9MICO|nr:hypothetical protein ET495_17400 [Xylanimonas allomyrinae]